MEGVGICLLPFGKLRHSATCGTANDIHSRSGVPHEHFGGTLSSQVALSASAKLFLCILKPGSFLANSTHCRNSLSANQRAAVPRLTQSAAASFRTEIFP